MAVSVGDRVAVQDFDGAALYDATGCINTKVAQAYAPATGVVKKVDGGAYDPLFYVTYDDPALEQIIKSSGNTNAGCLLRHNLSEDDQRKYYDGRR